MIRSAPAALLALAVALLSAGTADAQSPVRSANSRNVKLFFDDELLKAATGELELARRYEAEALAHVLADCDVVPLMAETPDECTRAINYFLVVNAPANTALPRLLMAMHAAAREIRPRGPGTDESVQKRAFERWARINTELAAAARGRLQALARDER